MWFVIVIERNWKGSRSLCHYRITSWTGGRISQGSAVTEEITERVKDSTEQSGWFTDRGDSHASVVPEGTCILNHPGRRSTCATRYFTGQPVRCKVLITFPHEVCTTSARQLRYYLSGCQPTKSLKGTQCTRPRDRPLSPRLTANLSKAIFYRSRTLQPCLDRRAVQRAPPWTISMPPSEQIPARRLKTSSTSAPLDASFSPLTCLPISSRMI